MNKFGKSAVALFALFALVGCGGKESVPKPSVSDKGGEGISETPSASENNDASENTVASTSSPSQDVKEDEVIVTFKYNFDGAPSDKTSNEIKGQIFSSFPSRERTGYLFAYWSTDEGGSNVFDLTTKAKEGIVLYANWIEDKDDASTVTFHSEDKVYITRSTNAARGDRLKAFPGKPYRKGYYLKNWYDSAEFTNPVKQTKKFDADADIYARWFTIDTFEAEYTKLDGLTSEEDKNINGFGEKIGHGYSSDVSGTGLIFNGSIVEGGCSNDHFVCDLYYKEAFIQFDIEAENATDDAILKASLSAEYFDRTFTKENWIVSVNGVSIDYGTIVLDNVPSGRDVKRKKAFSEFTLSTALSLKKGKNVIKLITNNSTRHDASGTRAAEAPRIDCLTCYSDTALTFDAHLDNLA